MASDDSCVAVGGDDQRHGALWSSWTGAAMRSPQSKGSEPPCSGAGFLQRRVEVGCAGTAGQLQLWPALRKEAAESQQAERFPFAGVSLFTLALLRKHCFIFN